jgi:hypothetical protein
MATYPKCQKLMEELVLELLKKEISVIFDFGGNDRGDRDWVRKILEASGAEHVCYVIETSADICRSRFMASADPGKMPVEHFEKILKRYDPPSAGDGWVVRHIPAS